VGVGIGASNDNEGIDPIDKCVHCGFCLESCPTYVVTRSEVHSPRGRIMAVKLGLNTEGIETCMFCRRCEVACPSGVEYERIITRARKPDTFKKFMLKAVERPNLLYLASRAVMSGNGPLSLRMRKFITHVDEPIRQVEENPDIYLLPGCITSVFFKDTVEKALSFLRKRGMRVTVLSGCCGLAHYSEGDVEGGDRAMNRMIPRDEVPMVSLSSNCTAHLREKGVRVMDFHEFLESQGVEVKIGNKFTIHYPCHANLLGITKSIQRVIRDKENMTEMDDPSFECGAGGSFFLFNDEISDAVIEEKNRKVNNSGAEVVISTNPACSLVLKRSGKRVLHLADLL